MDDLVGIAAQQELARRLQARQRERELHPGKVLHLVDDEEVPVRDGKSAPLVRDEIAWRA